MAEDFPKHPWLGRKAKDKLPGFEGRITGMTQFITGCNQFLVQPEMKKDGTMIFTGVKKWRGGGGEHDAPVYEKPKEMNTPDREVYESTLPKEGNESSTEQPTSE